MRLVRQSLVTVVTTALIAGVLIASPAAARTDAPHDDRRAGPHFPASVETTVPPGGYATITTPTIPKDAKTLKVDLVAQANATQPEVDAFDKLATVMGKMTKANRLLTCIMLHNALVTFSADDNYDDPVSFQASEAFAALVALVACVRLAGLLDSDPARVTATAPAAPTNSLEAAMRRCAQDKPGVPGSLQKTDGGWTLTVDGVLKKARNKLKVGCRTTSGKTVLKVRAAKKGVPLRKVLGKRPQFSLVSPPDAAAGAPTKVTLSLP